MGRFSEHFTTEGVFKMHGIKVHLDNVTIEYTQDEEGVYPNVIGAIKKTRRRGEVDLDDHPKFIGMLDFIENENQQLIYELTEEDAKERADYEQDMRDQERDYWDSQFSAAELRNMRG